MLLTTYVAFILTATLIGLAGGWWLRSRGAARAEAPIDSDEVRRAQELLGCLRKMASTVAGEIGEHSTRVEEINGELAGGKLQEPAKILNVVTRLVDVNKTMQGRLDQAEDRLREQVRLVESHAAEARTNALTLVGNRRAFDSDIAQCLADFRGAGKLFTLAMIDLDKFKRLNDTYGHQAGDEVLRGTGRVLRRVLRESDSICRFGGEEFAVIFSRATAVDVQRTLNRLRKTIAKTDFQGPNGKLEVTISIGAAQAAGEETQETIIQRADAALYASKEAGRNCGHWHDGKKIVLIADEEDKLPPVPQTPQPAAAKTVAPKPAAAPRPIDSNTSEKLADDLPALLNRTAFCQHVRTRMAEWKRGGPALSLALVEIDDFNAHARTYGPKIRDLLVVGLRALFSPTSARWTWWLVTTRAAWASCCPAPKAPDAIRVTERIREAASRVSFQFNGQKLCFTVSGGLISADAAEDMVAMFRKAEAPWRPAHQHGGNCLFQHDGQQSQQLAVAEAVGA